MIEGGVRSFALRSEGAEAGAAADRGPSAGRPLGHRGRIEELDEGLPALDPGRKTIEQLIAILPGHGQPDRAFPDDGDAPAGIAQGAQVAQVAGTVAEYLLAPETDIARRWPVVTAGMAMPEAAMDQDDSPVPCQLQVGTAGKATGVRAVAKAAREKPGADEELGLRVRAVDAGHHAAAGGFGDGVHT